MKIHDEKLINKIVNAVLQEFEQEENDNLGSRAFSTTPPPSDQILEIVDELWRKEVAVQNPADYKSLKKLHQFTPARVAIGRAGNRLRSNTLLLMRSDQAAAFDAVYKEVDANLLNELNLFCVQTMCNDSDTFVTRPDLGRRLNEEAKKELKSRCTSAPDIQIYLSDGLSSSAVEANASNILPAIITGLKTKKISAGTPFYLRFGRVGAMDEISELLNAKVTCVLLGERPGLLTAQSMSAYIAYQATVGMPESNRTVISNIHPKGTPAVEAGAYIAEVLSNILELEASGVNLRNKVML